MRKNISGILLSLLALTISGCTTTPKKKPRKNSSSSLTSEISSPSAGASSSGAAPTSAGTSSSSEPDPTSQTSEIPVSSSISTPAPTSETSVVPPASSSISTPAPTSASSVIPPAPSSSSVVPEPSSSSTLPPQPSSSSTIPVPTGDTDYSKCQTEYEHGNRDGLMSEMRAVIKSGQSGSYDGLWTTYKKAYVRSDGYIYDYYSNITNYVPGDDQDHGSHPQENYSYNREHSIPKSWWGGDYSTGTQGCDPFIVVPTDAKINEIRSNYAFGYVSSVTESSANNYSLLGYADETWGYSGKVFEPNDEVKGDFARIYFYALTKYDVSSWDSGDGSEFFSGNLSKYFGLTDYAIKLLSYWSNLDPVSAWERSVNNKIEPIQNNRNPFIDHPEYANVLWGNHSSYTIYNH